jgi:hypothetical protein
MPLTEEERKERARAYRKKYNEKNKDRNKIRQKEYNKKNKVKKAAYNKAYFKIYYAANKEKRKADNAAYRQANIGSIKARDAAYYRANRDRIRVYNRHLYHSIEKTPERRKVVAARGREQTKKLADGYIRRVICGDSSLTAKEIPQSLIEAKRLELQAKRYFKEIENG